MWLKIEVDVNSRLKVSWGGTGGVYHYYYVGYEGIEKAAANVRTQLESLSRWAESTDPAVRREGLVKLAEAGASLRYRLFSDPANMSAIRNLEQRIAEDYDAGDNVLSIQVDSSVHAPWGLAYEGKVPALETTAVATQSNLPAREIDEFGGFWSLRYRLSATSSGYMGPRSKMKRARKTFGLLSLVNSEVQQQIESDLGQPDAYRTFCQLMSPPVGVAHTLAECTALIDKTEQVDVLFHFLGHHDGEALDLGNGQKIDYDAFSQLLDSLTGRFEQRGVSPCGLLFLNGCESALGDKDFSLRAQAARPELCGAIATEARVRRTYAAKFGYRFLKAMVSDGMTVADVMDDLHHDAALWPESLLYGCYANPDYRIEKPAALDPAPVAAPPGNP
jgi:hypothetical protein